MSEDLLKEATDLQVRTKAGNQRWRGGMRTMLGWVESWARGVAEGVTSGERSPGKRPSVECVVSSSCC